ncbi:FmdB family zinc ribbon protein [Polymorphospora rubra]|uniref:FmdB family zinc ribbon protein n=1 Tax=Polymorphospora rubra TaxID=338584 RepID=UPI0033ED2249
MPTYQYACTACGHQLEAVQSFADEPLTECPACEGRLRKLFNSVGIVFKGSGFYRTDSRSGSGSADSSTGGKPAKTESSGSSDAGAKSSGSKDSGGSGSKEKSSSSTTASSGSSSSSGGSTSSGGAST